MTSKMKAEGIEKYSKWFHGQLTKVEFKVLIHWLVKGLKRYVCYGSWVFHIYKIKIATYDINTHKRKKKGVNSSQPLYPMNDSKIRPKSKLNRLKTYSTVKLAFHEPFVVYISLCVYLKEPYKQIQKKHNYIIGFRLMWFRLGH